MADEGEYLRFIHRYYAASIRAADQKALVILTLAVAVFVYLVAHSATLRSLSDLVFAISRSELRAVDLSVQDAIEPMRGVLWVAGMISCLVAQLTAVRALQPRIYTAQQDQIYWANVTRLGFAGFVDHTKNAALTGDYSSLYSSTYGLAQILRDKYHSAGAATRWTLRMIYLVAGYVILALFAGLELNI